MASMQNYTTANSKVNRYKQFNKSSLNKVIHIDCGKVDNFVGYVQECYKM